MSYNWLAGSILSIVTYLDYGPLYGCIGPIP